MESGDALTEAPALHTSVESLSDVAFCWHKSLPTNEILCVSWLYAHINNGWMRNDH